MMSFGKLTEFTEVKICDLPHVEANTVYEVATTNDKLFFRYKDSQGYELWVSDGSAAGTHIVKDIVVGEQSSFPDNFVVLGNKLLFAAVGGLWITDGNEDSTMLLKSFETFSLLSQINGTVFLRVHNTNNGYDLWKTDGTVIGTQKIIPPSNAIDPLEYQTFKYKVFLNTFYFTAKYDGVSKWYKINVDSLETAPPPPVSSPTNSLSVSPNPSTDIITVTSNQYAYITISNLSGGILYVFYLDNSSQTIDISGLQSGTYFINSSNGESTIFIKN